MNYVERPGQYQSWQLADLACFVDCDQHLTVAIHFRSFLGNMTV